MEVSHDNYGEFVLFASLSCPPLPSHGPQYEINVTPMMLEILSDGSFERNTQPVPAGALDATLRAAFDARPVKLPYQGAHALGIDGFIDWSALTSSRG